ncbi:MAG: hypothetical protein NTV61_00645 [Candidatus Bathyarchaeota archaeon]|nr:hypothetical protein [Candidatus Bathyarchaeota archaeon]
MDEYYRIPDYPDHISGTAVLARMLDGLGFRFYWATEGLRAEDYAFRPAKDTMSIEELVTHVWSLMNWVSSSALNRPYEKPGDGPAARVEALRVIHDLKAAMLAMSDEELGKLRIRDKPFWNIVNGPFSDALTHTGQINSFRRLAGNPVAGANVFLGEPPKTG